MATDENQKPPAISLSGVEDDGVTHTWEWGVIPEDATDEQRLYGGFVWRYRNTNGQEKEVNLLKMLERIEILEKRLAERDKNGTDTSRTQ